METAHEWQVKYYIWLLEQNGVEEVKGILEYPKLRKTKEIELTIADKNYLQQVINEIGQLVIDETCPQRINSNICKKCSYYDFCYIDD